MSTTTKTARMYIVTIVTEEHDVGLHSIDDIDSTVVGTIAEAKTLVLDSVKRLTGDRDVIGTVETKLANLGAPIDAIYIKQGDRYGMSVYWTITTLA